MIMKFNSQGFNAVGFLVLLNEDADKLLLHPPVWMFLNVSTMYTF